MARKSEVALEYEKQYKRLQQFIRRAKKRGYIFPDTAIPAKLKRPNKRSVEKLSKITPEVLYKKATYINPYTGTIAKGTEGRLIERRAQAKKAAKTKSTIKENYSREQQRVNALLDDLSKTAKSRGYLFPKNYISEIRRYISSIPVSSIGILQLSSFTEESILSDVSVIFKDPRTKTAFKGYEGLEIEEHRKKIADQHPLTPDTKASEKRRILELVREYINTWTPSPLWTEWFATVKERDKNQLERQLDGAIMSEGEEVVAQRLQDHAVEAIDIVQRVLYESGGKNGREDISFAMVRFSAIILGRVPTQEESEAITALSELNEV